MSEEITRLEAARALGRVKSPAKAAAARANGKLGGRPRGKTKPVRAENPAPVSNPNVEAICARHGAVLLVSKLATQKQIGKEPQK